MIDLVEYKKIVQVDTTTGRRYITPEKNEYPSVTTVLNQIPKPELNAWRERVGEDEAMRIMRSASNAGDKLHKSCEKFLLEEELPPMAPNIRMLFNTIKPELLKIEKVIGIEIPLYSDFLKCAGRADCIGYYDGELSIIDFKNSRKHKKESWIESYFLQTTIYAMMFMEMYKKPVKNIIILMAVWDGSKLVFRQPVRKRLDDVVELMKEYNYLWK